MAIYHFHVNFVSRSSGRSAVQTAAYITGTKLKETRRNLIADYRNRAASVLFYQTLAPSHAPDCMKGLEVWDRAESYEDEYALLHYHTEHSQEKYKNSAQTAQTVIAALPKELNFDAWQELVTDFAVERFVSRGLVVTVAIHKDEGNPHAHFVISRRSVNENGKWSWTKDREITTKSALIESRKLWADKTNAYLVREGVDARVDHRSYADMGIPFEPSKHESWYAGDLRKRGIKSRIAEENKETQNRNKEYLGLHPEEILKELTLHQATFSTLDLSRAIQKRVPDDAVLASYIFEASLSQAAIVGTGLDGQTRYTSQDYLQLETEALNLAQTLMQRKASLAIEKVTQEEALNTTYAYLSPEQQQAVKTLCGDQGLSVLIGRAGTGKTTTLKPVIDLHDRAGHQVWGLSLSTAAAENLSLETGCTAESLAFYLDKWDRLEKANQALWSLHSSQEHRVIEKTLKTLAPYTLTSQHLVVVDEAGMIGTRQWAELLRHIEKAGAKLIAVGDDHQFKAIEAGDFFRKLIEEAKLQNQLSSLLTIIRQKQAWMREASQDLAELRTYEALATYEKQGAIQRLEGSNFSDIAKAYVEQRINKPEETGLLLASTRADCQALNREVRKHLQEQGLLSTTEVFIQGRPFSMGDEIIFLKNDREKTIACFDSNNDPQSFLVKNKTKAKIVNIETHTNPDESFCYQITAEVNPDTILRFNSNEYEHFDHSYALTLYKAQGLTVDWSLIYLSKYMDAYALYVALTRHRSQVRVFYDGRIFSTFKDLQKSVSRLSRKDLVIDYSIQPEHQAAWETVQDYVLLGQDLIATIREKNWPVYHRLKTEREILGRQILSAWAEHRAYVQQAGLSQEALEIACGLKMRPLSYVEQQAYRLVQEYAQKAMQARHLWREIRHTHPGNHCYQHSKYSEFTELRETRNQLAKEIISNRPLYKEFVPQLGRDLGIGWKTLINQANQKIFTREATDTHSFKQADNLKSGEVNLDSNREGNIKSDHDQVDKSLFRKDSIHSFAFKQGSYDHRPYQGPFVKADPEQVKRELNERIESLAQTLLGEPKNHSSREYRYGNKGSVSVCIAGAKQGLYSNFETGSYGGGLKLIEESLNLEYKQAYQWALDWLGLNQQRETAHTKSALKPKEAGQATFQKQDWTPIFPVPPSFDDNRSFKQCLAYQLKKHGREEIARYAYRDTEGHLLGYTIRLENEEGKVVLPLTYCQSADGKYPQWRWQGFGKDRPLYGLEKLKTYPDKPVLIVEGEKTADSAQNLFPDHAVLTWSGGTGAVHKTDWFPLADKTITLWPDNDSAGIEAVHQITEQLIKINPEQETKLHIVKLPLNTPEKWDLADPLPQDWTINTLKEIAAAGSETHKVNLAVSIKEALSKYRLEKPFDLSEQDFENRVETLFKKMTLWSKVLSSHSIEQDQKLFEKAVVVEGIREKARQEYCFLATPAEALIRSEGIALVTANLIQENGQKRYSRTLLKEAAKIHDNQLENQAQSLFIKYQEQHPQASQSQLQTLVDQHFQCWNMVSKTLTEDVQKTILKSSETLGAMQQKGQIQDFMKTHSSLNKENEKAFLKVCERHWIEKSFSHSSENKVSDLFKETARSIDKSSPRPSLSLSQTRDKQPGLER